MSSFQVTVKDQVTLVKCPAEMNTVAAQELSTLIPTWVDKPNKVYVFDFTDVTSVSAVIYKPFTLFHQAMKKLDHYLFSVGMNREISRSVQLSGLEGVFNIKPDLKTAMEAA